MNRSVRRRAPTEPRRTHYQQHAVCNPLQMRWAHACTYPLRKPGPPRRRPKEGTMKRFTNYMTTAAAVLMITAGVASAQNLMKAEIPFAFVAGGKVLEPGIYHVQVIAGMTSNVVLSVKGQHRDSRVA